MQINITHKNRKPPYPNTVLGETLWYIVCKIYDKNLEPYKYKNVVLGLVFLKHTFDVFMTNPKTIKTIPGKFQSHEKHTINLLLVPNDYHWFNITRQVHQPNTGQIMDYAMSFYSTPIQVYIKILSKKCNKGDILFMDMRMMSHMKDRTCHILNDIPQITYDAWCNHYYKDISGFCKSVNTVEINLQYYMLESWRYVGEISSSDVSSVWWQDNLSTKYNKPQDKTEGSGVIHK